VIAAAIAVHRALGPGLLESAYQACLAYEFDKRRLAFEREKALPLEYGDVKLDCGYRLDFLVAGGLIVEVKAVDEILPIHRAQLLSYLRMSGCKLGLLINFNVQRLLDGVCRMVNRFPEPAPSRRALR